MSRKTTKFKHKITQFRSKNPSGNTGVLIPRDRVRGGGTMTVLAIVDETGEDGREVRAGRRMKGINAGTVCTEPMETEKEFRLLKLAK